jgi:hypothetical protein
MTLSGQRFVVGISIWLGSVAMFGQLAEGTLAAETGPEAAMAFARSFRGDREVPKELHCYPAAVGVPWEECEHIIPMTAGRWTPEQLSADFQRRMAGLPAAERKRGIVVILKTERCATKWLRACTVTTAAFEKRSTPLAGEFLVYGVLLKPRDDDGKIPGSAEIETGAAAWKNDAARLYRFEQGPGAAIVFLDPKDGSEIAHTDAVALELFERPFVRDAGRTPVLHAKLVEVLETLKRRAG